MLGERHQILEVLQAVGELIGVLVDVDLQVVEFVDRVSDDVVSAHFCALEFGCRKHLLDVFDFGVDESVEIDFFEVF